MAKPIKKETNNSSKDFPLISIVTCTYNSKKFLKKALKSIEQQTYPNIEHIFNDAFSTDGTVEILRKYIAKNKDRYPIKFIQSPPKGVANALNTAMPYTTGEFVHFLHSDDYYFDKNSLRKAVKYLTDNPKYDWVTGNFLFEFKNRLFTLPYSKILKPNPQRALHATNVVSHENTLIRRTIILKYGGFNENVKCPIEYRLWLRVIKKHPPLVVDDAFTVFIINERSISTGSPFALLSGIFECFATMRSEHIIPLIGSYEDKYVYKKVKPYITKINSARKTVVRRAKNVLRSK